MLSKLLRPIAAAFGHLLIWCCVAAAQPGDTPSAPGGEKLAKPQAAAEKSSAEEASPPRVEESRPSVYYLPDKQGNLQPVLDFTYQDFVELYKLKNQLGRRDEPPRYSLQRMTVTGSAGEEYAELKIRFQVLVRDDGWVRVPLRLDQGLLRGAVEYKGPGEQFVHYEGEGEGYVCWVRGKADTQHEITLTMLVSLATVGDETRLKLFAPRATVSELKLTVPIAAAVGRVSDGVTLPNGLASRPRPPAKPRRRPTGIERRRPGGRLPLGLAQVESACGRDAPGVGGLGHGVHQAGQPLDHGRGDPLGAKLWRGLRPIHRAIAAGDGTLARGGQWLRRHAAGARRNVEGAATVGHGATAEEDGRAGRGSSGLPPQLRPAEESVVVRVGRFRGPRRGSPVGHHRRRCQRRLASALGNHH